MIRKAIALTFLAWQINPFDGAMAPEELTGYDAKEMIGLGDIDGPLVDYKAKGNTVELAGKEELEASPVYKLKVTLKDGDVRYLYPQEPNIVYAGTWQFRRSPYFFTSGGPGSGLPKSTDARKTWKKLTKGLPEGDLGRIAIAVAPTRPNVVYAIVEAKKSALYRSEDLGETWTKMSSSPSVTGRPFYFARILVDPKDYNRLYKPDFMTREEYDKKQQDK